MQKRSFLAAAALGGAALAAHGQGAGKSAGKGAPALLTVTGAIGKGNRGGLDPALDQLMVKQKIAFDRAHALDFASLAAMPAVTIRPTLEYDKKVHALSGPRLLDVLQATGAKLADGHKLFLRAIDGYAPTLSVADARKYGFIVATHLDGKPMPLGGLGPLWAVYDADRAPDMAAKPVDQRFALCPWGLYHVEVQAA